MRICFCIILILLLSTIVFSETFHFFLKEIWRENDKKMRCVDIDGDGIDEIISHPWQRELDILDWRLSTFLTSTHVPTHLNDYIDVVPSFYTNSAYLYGAHVTDDSIVYHVFLKGDARERYKRFLDKTMLSFYRHPATNPVDFSRQSIGFFDVFQNVENDTLALFRKHTTYDRKGFRGLIAYDLRTFEPAWEFHFGPRANEWVICDIDGDIADEIIVGTSAPYNGISFNNIPDSSAFVICVNDNGALKWTFNAGPYFTACRIELFNLPGGEQQLFVHRYGGANNEHLKQDAVWLLDLQTGTVKQRKDISFVSGIESVSRPDICCDFNGDGIDEAVVGMKNGCVRMFDRSLDEIAASEYFDAPVSVEAVADFDEDGIVEIAAYVNGQKLVILSNELQVLCQLDLASVRFNAVRVVRTEHGNKLLLSYQDGDKKIDSLFELKRILFPMPKASAKISAIFIIIAGIVCCGAVFIIISQRKKYDVLVQRVIESPKIRNQLLIVTSKGMIVNAGESWRNLLDLTDDENVAVPLLEQEVFRSEQEQMAQLLIGRQTRVDSAVQKDEKVHAFRIESLPVASDKGQILYLHDKDEDHYIKHLKLWAPIAQRLAHSIKNPLTTVNLTLDDVQKSLKKNGPLHNENAVENLCDISRQITKIEQLCNDFMRFAKFEHPQLKPMPINELIDGWLYEWKPNSTDIELHFDLDNNIPDALVDERYLREACHHVFINAVESLNGAGHIKVSTQVIELYNDSRRTKKYIQLSFKDTGRGIPARYLENIKKPYFSTKNNGTGLGLSVVEKNMDMMNGSYHIDSAEGLGTTVFLVIPVAE